MVFYRVRPYEMKKDQTIFVDEPYNLEERKVLDQLIMDIHGTNGENRWKKFTADRIELKSVEELMNHPKVKDLKDATIVFNNKIIQIARGFDPGLDFYGIKTRIHKNLVWSSIEPTRENIIWYWAETGRKESLLVELISSSMFSLVLCGGLIEKGSMFHDFLTKGTPETTKIYDPRLTLFIRQFI